MDIDDDVDDAEDKIVLARSFNIVNMSPSVDMANIALSVDIGVFSLFYFDGCFTVSFFILSDVYLLLRLF